MNVSGCDGVAAKVLEGHQGLDGGGTTRGGQSFDGGDAGVHRAHRNQGLAVQQAGSVRHEGIPHPRALSLREGIHARVVGVIHEVLDHRLRTLNRGTSDGARRRRGVADAVPLAAAIGLRPAGPRGVEGVQQAEVVTDLVGQGAVEIVVEDQVEFVAHSEDLVVDHNAIVHARRGGQISEAERRESAVHAGQDPNVDVFVSGPMAERLDVHLRGRVTGQGGDHACAGEAGNHLGHIDAVDAGGGLSIRVPYRQGKFNVDVSAAKCALEVGVQRVDGTDDLGLGDVGSRSKVVPVVHDVHHHGEGVGLAGPEPRGGHVGHGGLKGEITPRKGCICQLSGMHRVRCTATRLGVCPSDAAQGSDHKEGGEKTELHGRSFVGDTAKCKFRLHFNPWVFREFSYPRPLILYNPHITFRATGNKKARSRKPTARLWLKKRGK